MSNGKALGSNLKVRSNRSSQPWEFFSSLRKLSNANLIRDRGSVFGASTSTEIAHIIAFVPKKCGRLVAKRGQLLVDGFHVRLRPAH